MGVKGDDILLAGVHEGTESPNKVAKAAKRTFAAGLDLLTLKKSNPPPPPTFLNMSRQEYLDYDYEFEVCPASGSVSPDQP